MNNRAELIKVWKERPISWSQLGSWAYSKQQWIDKYIFGLNEEPNLAMLFGNTVGDTLGTPNSMVPSLEKHLVGLKEYELKTTLNGMTLIGYADHYCPCTKVLNENKTSENKNRWNQTLVDLHGQLHMYSLILLLSEKVKPEDLRIFLNFIPVTTGNDFQQRVNDSFLRFETKRTTKDVLQFGSKIKKTIEDMEKFALAYKVI